MRQFFCFVFGAANLVLKAFHKEGPRNVGKSSAIKMCTVPRVNVLNGVVMCM